jgi:hypothetical protein
VVKAAFNAKGRLVVTIACGADGPLCSGRIAVTAKPKGKTIKLARKRYSVASGEQKRFTLKIKKSKREAATKRGKVRFKVTAGAASKSFALSPP